MAESKKKTEDEQPVGTPVNPPAEKAEIVHADIIENPQAEKLAEDPKPIATGDPTVPRADSHDPRPAE